MNRNKKIQRAALMVVVLTACCVMPAMAAGNGIMVDLENIMLRPMSLWEMLIRCFHALFGVAMY